MAQTHELTLFWGITPRRGFFVFDKAPTREIEWPFRVCKKSILIHIWPGKALVIGRWQWSELSETEALLEALEGTNLGFQGQGFKASATEATEDQGNLGY